LPSGDELISAEEINRWLICIFRSRFKVSSIAFVCPVDRPASVFPLEPCAKNDGTVLRRAAPQELSLQKQISSVLLINDTNNR